MYRHIYIYIMCVIYYTHLFWGPLQAPIFLTAKAKILVKLGDSEKKEPEESDQRGTPRGNRGHPLDSPGENGDLPGENGDLPGENGDSPGKNGDLPGKNGDLPGKNGDLPGENGDLPGENGDFRWIYPRGFT